MSALPRALRIAMAITDVGFVAYWAVTALGLVPASFAYAGYDEPALVAWNWSFLPLDLAVSASGLAALALDRRGDPRAAPLALVSLVATSASGLLAIAFFALRRDFAPGWWAPNLALLLYPVPFIRSLVSRAGSAPTTR